MKLWQAIALIIFTFVFFWVLTCYGATGKPKRCQTCCLGLPATTYLRGYLSDKYEVLVPVNDEARTFKVTITNKQNDIDYCSGCLEYTLEDVKSGKIVEKVQGLLYYNELSLTLFAVIPDAKYPDSPIVRTLDCAVGLSEDIATEPQAKGYCRYFGTGQFNTVIPRLEPAIFKRR